MALRARSLFLWGFEINVPNRSIDFKSSSLGAELTATLSLGYYSLSGLLNEIKRAMEAVDPSHIYSVSADRSIAGGTENRVTIATNGTFLSLLFLTGTHNQSSTDTLLGFTHTDKTGATTYTGSSTAGTALITEQVGFSYLGPEKYQEIQGVVNVAASGFKEAVVFQIMEFLQITCAYEPGDKVDDEWNPFMRWAIQQRQFDFTPEIIFPEVFYNVTMETTSANQRALAFTMPEQLPDFPNYYTTGSLKMRLVL